MYIQVEFEMGTANPRIVRMKTDATFSQVTTAGWYSNQAPNQLLPTDEVEIAYAQGTVNATTGLFNVSITSGVVTLSASDADVITPTIADHIAVFTNTSGTISDDASTAINGGNIQAGLSGTAGYLASFPSTASKGSLRLTGVANTGDTVTTISNAAMGQASVISIPDPGQTTSEFIIADSAGTQHITSGGLQADVGPVSVGLAAGGANGSFIAYPNPSGGSLRLSAIQNSGGDFYTQISNAGSVGQDQVITIPDSGAAAANFLLSASASAQSLGGGLIVSSGNIQSGVSGTAGSFISYPATAANGMLILSATDAGADFDTTITNAGSIAQDQVVSIPDSGQATSEFIIADSGGTQHITSGAFQVDAGSISSGLAAGGFIGRFDAYSTTTASGILSLVAADNASGDFDTTISNSTAVGQDQVISVPDSGLAAASFDVSPSESAGVAPKAIVRTINATAAALATSGHVAVQAAPSATSQFTIVDVKVMYQAAGLSGGGGDRLLTLTDGTIVFNQSGITAALLGTPVYTVWGDTGNPIPGSVSTTSTAGADIYLVYAGGATDYTTGDVTIQVTLAQVTA